MSSISGCLQIMYSRPVSFRYHVFKVGLFRELVYKVRIVKRSCHQGQDCLEVMFSRLGLFRGPVFKVRFVRGHVFKVRVF